MIGFYNKEIGFELKNKRMIKKWIKTVIEQYRKKCGNINVIFCSDPFILQMNRQFLNHDYYTDIITFDYCEEDFVSGDLYISIDTVSANAEEYGEVFETELHRVMIHGILHLLALNDHTEDQIREMRKAEDESLSLLERMVSLEKNKEREK